MMSAKSGYISIYFSLKNDGTLSSGAFAEICLIGNAKGDVITMPHSAISEQQGNYFVYVKSGQHSYQKRLVTLGLSDGILTEITSGLNDGDMAVVNGASIVKLAETSGAVPEGHSHNH